MSKDELVLLDCIISPFCMRVKIALAEKGLEYEARAEDLCGDKSELLITSNPIYQKVPVLLHNGKPLCESTIIVTYIDETWPSPPLLPSSPKDRSHARFWADYIDKKVFDAVCNIWKSKVGEVPEEAKMEFVGIVKVLEGALGNKEYFGGEKFGFVDISLIPITSWFYTVEKIGNLNVEKESPNITEWVKRCMKIGSVAKAIPEPEKVYESVLQMRKMFGID